VEGSCERDNFQVPQSSGNLTRSATISFSRKTPLHLVNRLVMVYFTLSFAKILQRQVIG
jgi:hypothetical protein